MEIPFHTTTANRLKGYQFAEPIMPDTAISGLSAAWEVASGTFEDPLVQLRCIVPLALEANLIDLVSAENQEDKSEMYIAGRIPFVLDGDTMGLYYVHQESAQRHGFIASGPIRTHQDAINRALRPRASAPLSPDYRIHTVQFSGDTAYDLLTDRVLDFLPRESVVDQICQLHQEAFAHPHDVSQRTTAGVNQILDHNPIFLACQGEHLAAVGFVEQDSSVVCDQYSLCEPTYFTQVRHRSHGLSRHLRDATRRWVDTQGNVLCFAESIRSTSFPLSLQSGFSLGGTPESLIPGDLGNAYTYIGDANPESGYMPMGLSYYVSKSISQEL